MCNVERLKREAKGEEKKKMKGKKEKKKGSWKWYFTPNFDVECRQAEGKFPLDDPTRLRVSWPRLGCDFVLLR